MGSGMTNGDQDGHLPVFCHYSGIKGNQGPLAACGVLSADLPARSMRATPSLRVADPSQNSGGGDQGPSLQCPCLHPPGDLPPDPHPQMAPRTMFSGRQVLSRHEPLPAPVTARMEAPHALCLPRPALLSPGPEALQEKLTLTLPLTQFSSHPLFPRPGSPGRRLSLGSHNPCAGTRQSTAPIVWRNRENWVNWVSPIPDEGSGSFRA